MPACIRCFHLVAGITLLWLSRQFRMFDTARFWTLFLPVCLACHASSCRTHTWASFLPYRTLEAIQPASDGILREVYRRVDAPVHAHANGASLPLLALAATRPTSCICSAA